MHRYVCVFVCLCVYIKQPLTAIGGGGGPIGVFALAAVQHSTFLCDIQYCDLRKPAQQRSALSLSLSLYSLSFLPPPHSSLFLSLSPSLPLDHLLHPVFFIFGHGKSSVNPHPPYNSNSSAFPIFLLPKFS